MFLVVLEKNLESPLDCKEIKPVSPKGNQPWIIHWKDWCLSSNTLGTWFKELSHWKRSWCWERLKAGGEGDNRRWDGSMASLTRRTWVWVNSGRWWRTGAPVVLQSIGCLWGRKGSDTTQGLNDNTTPHYWPWGCPLPSPSQHQRWMSHALRTWMPPGISPVLEGGPIKSQPKSCVAVL